MPGQKKTALRHLKELHGAISEISHLANKSAEISKDEGLKKTVISIGVRPDGMNSSSVLSADYLHLQERVQEKIVDEVESNDWLFLIAKEFEQINKKLDKIFRIFFKVIKKVKN